LASSIVAVRRFNRLYTKKIGALQEGHLGSPFSLTEVRVLYELAHREGPTASALVQELGLDPGYLSRTLAGLERRRLILRRASASDGRQSLLSLTEAGRRAFAQLDERASAEVARLLEGMAPALRPEVVAAMQRIEAALLGQPQVATEVVIRGPRAGDMGWVVHRHGALYGAEYGWDQRFEGLVAEIVARFMAHADAQRERCWIAERGGENVGSVFLVKRSARTAQLRLLLVEPRARGLGVGGRLVGECVRFARAAGYRKLVLWTNDVLLAARRVYERAGFRLVTEAPHASFGEGLIAQTWELEL
jgi:DNA-binding MarR family transcriptional regulator/N-acetylglutamate synthase-like GNAT family acetyltransferase